MAEVMEADPKAVAAAEAALKEQGISPLQKAQVDYFGFDENLQVMLPDGMSWVEHKVLNEGQRRKYLNAVNRDVRIQRATGDALMRMSPGDEKLALLTTAIVGWNLTRNGMPVAFSDRALKEFLDLANPKIVDHIEKEIRKANPWLMAELTVEDIQKEIDSLEEMKAKRMEEDQGKEILKNK